MEDLVNMEEKNMDIYNKLKAVPDEAKKTITGGRLKGMTDIKPMWRIEMLTKTFGPAGLGWKAPIINKSIIEGANGEKIATVDIELYYRLGSPDTEWIGPVTGTGGSSFVAKETNGLYTSDECFKMAYTDALSVACKSLGMGADVYWGDSKYQSKPEQKVETKEQAENYVVNFGKHAGKTLKQLVNEYPGYIDWLYENGSSEIKSYLDLML